MLQLEKNIKQWISGADKDLEVAESLLKSKHYPQCLFFCHLSIEKLLKALIVKETKNHPPFIHDLRRLAEIAEIKLDIKQKLILDKISTFNIAGRYADKKFEFYKKYNNKEYAQKYFLITKKLFLWLKR